MTSKLAELEMKFQKIMEGEIKKVQDEFNESIAHVEHVLKQDIDYAWEYAVHNEQYSRKNNLRILGLEEHAGENLEETLVSFAKEHLHEDIQPEEIEIVQRIGRPRATDGEQGSSASASDQRSVKPRPVIVKFVSNKTKMCLLRKRMELKGKRMVIQEDVAPDIAKRLKKLKEKGSVELSWFSNGKIKFKLKHDSRILELKGWMDLHNIHDQLLKPILIK